MHGCDHMDFGGRGRDLCTSTLTVGGCITYSPTYVPGPQYMWFSDVLFVFSSSFVRALSNRSSFRFRTGGLPDFCLVCTVSACVSIRSVRICVREASARQQLASVERSFVRSSRL